MLGGVFSAVGMVALVMVPFLSQFRSRRLIDSKNAPTPQDLQAPVDVVFSTALVALGVALFGVIVFILSLRKIRRIDAAERNERAESWTG